MRRRTGCEKGPGPEPQLFESATRAAAAGTATAATDVDRATGSASGTASVRRGPFASTTGSATATSKPSQRAGPGTKNKLEGHHVAAHARDGGSAAGLKLGEPKAAACADGEAARARCGRAAGDGEEEGTSSQQPSLKTCRICLGEESAPVAVAGHSEEMLAPCACEGTTK